ncbi:Flp pilus assembly protein CpaB [Neorhizobium galegae]|uniref:Flp pilus assembly protein CpaB n=1 Tax=Neorhizobium galegae TaxID=399 RepID=UPI0006222A2C|nr:RcpC/CpaB family pilus assembly protein [Neorhizobium galegae]CDZ56625.1 Flp pilus assembly protein CpaB [Neorhizobium galegae bv. orientalis]KAB1122706.1 pilus assembly protein CpaB [Neorhizobium galegae]MCQ1570300.1 RcpC/CpaB family pilus assembly protein [Neorhizobium galegae]MCQ1807859.1 RcpC/CpaB family pilus assembly protein [Neorhizobium galegae]CDZ64315.1 Flp pilus assembly protein CpaB [Neorhizobium galegae bv. orientalis]
MNWKLIAAVVVGLITAGFFYFWTESVKNEQTAHAFMRLLPDKKVARGQAVTPDMLAPPIMLPESFGSLTKLAVPSGPAYSEWLKDRTAATDIAAGSVLLFQYFDDADGGRLTTMISAGKRALTLPVDAAEAVGNFVAPGSRVDIIGTVDEPVKPVRPPAPPAPVPPPAPAPGQNAGAPQSGQAAAGATAMDQMMKNMLNQQVPLADRTDIEAYQKQTRDYELGIGKLTRVVTRTFLQNVRVLAVGAATSPQPVATGRVVAYRHVTVEVTPQEAELLIFALGQSNGRLNLVLRNPGDDTVQELPSVNWTKM